MAAWKFTDDYKQKYPALEQSILNLLVFSSHTLSGANFTGTLDVAATGAALQTLGRIVDQTQIDVSGTVSENGNTLSVTLKSTDDEAFRKGVAGSLPLIGGSVTKAAWMDIQTISSTKDDPQEEPPTDLIDLSITFAIGSATATIVSQVPMNGGFFTLSGTFTGLGISLHDLNFLIGGTGTDTSWFPDKELGPYTQNNPAFGLLGLTLTAYIALEPGFKISIVSVTAIIGLSQLPLKGNALYMDPLGVWVTVVPNPAGKSDISWGLEGALKLCNYANPGPAGLSKPDFIFDFAMGFPNPPEQPNFSVSAQLENPSSQPVAVMIKDLLGPSTQIGIGDHLTIDAFEFSTSADVTTGKITDFSTSIAMSGGFGLLQDFDLEAISVSIAYSGD